MPPRILADRWPADAPPPFQVDALPAPDITWVAWLGAAVNPETAPARPYYLRAPDAKPSKDLLPKDLPPRQAAGRHDADGFLTRWFVVDGGTAVVEAASLARCAAAGPVARRIVSSRLGRRRIREPC